MLRSRAARRPHSLMVMGQGLGRRGRLLKQQWHLRDVHELFRGPRPRRAQSPSEPRRPILAVLRPCVALAPHRQRRHADRMPSRAPGACAPLLPEKSPRNTMRRGFASGPGPADALPDALNTITAHFCSSIERGGVRSLRAWHWSQRRLTLSTRN